MTTLIDELRARDRFLTTTEVMALLRRRRNTICDWVKTGLLPAIRTGSGYRFDPVVLATWLEQRSIGIKVSGATR